MLINSISFFVVTAGALLFTYPILLFRKIYQIEKKDDFRLAWFFLFALTFVFYVGYLMVAVYLFRLSQPMSSSEVIIVAFLLGGSIFVTMVARLFNRMVFSLEDIVVQRTNELEKVYKRAIETEKETRRLKDHFVFVAAHEIRTPVTSLRWCLELIDENNKNRVDPAEAAKLFRRMQTSLANLVELVDDLLDTSRLEYGTFKLKMSKSRISGVIRDTVDEMRPVAGKEGMEVAVDFGGLEEVEAVIDARRLGEVLTNLISNSIKFSPAGSKIKVSLERAGGDFIVKVDDAGVGLTEEDKKALFKKFSRPDNHPSDRFVQSTGLGLYIAKTIVERWDGKIWADSQGRGKGSTFGFSVPI